MIISYRKGEKATFNWQDVLIPYSAETIARTNRGAGASGLYGDNDAEEKHKNRLSKGGKIPEDWWIDLPRIQGNGLEKLGIQPKGPNLYLNESSKPPRMLATSFLTALWAAEQRKPWQ